MAEEKLLQLKKEFMANSFDNPPKVDDLIVSSVSRITNAYSMKKCGLHISEPTVKMVLESLAMYRQLLDIGTQKDAR